MRAMHRTVRCLPFLLLLGSGGAGCAQERTENAGAGPAAEVRAQVEAALQRAFERIAARADSIEDALQPVPLLTPAEESGLRRYPNQEQLARARQLGVPRPQSEEELTALRREGALVPLDTTRYWVVRELEHSRPLVTPDVRALLTEIGERFHARLEELGLPPFRLEITSALRTAESQRELRETNPNAAGGVSTHEFGTTVDVAYSSFAAPAEPMVELEAPGAAWLVPYLRRGADLAAEAAAARKSRELQAILGRVLREMQAEGLVMVTLEERQPVYHMTVARRF